MAQYYPSVSAFHRALLGSQAKTCGRTTEEVQREYFIQRFLARVFSSPDSRWILTGGGGMLVRIPGARHSQDVDLLHPGTDIIGAVDELRTLSVRPDLDRFTFEIEAKGSLTGVSRGAQLKATVYLGTTRVGNFPVDIAIERTLVGPVERLQPHLAVESADVSTLPASLLYLSPTRSLTNYARRTNYTPPRRSLPQRDSVISLICSSSSRHARSTLKTP